MTTLQAAAATVLGRAIARAGLTEICAYLLADSVGEQIVFRVANYSAAPMSFFVPQSEITRMRAFASTGALEVIAFVHSQLSGLELSASDDRARAASGLPWIVVRLENGRLTYCWYDAGSGQPVQMIDG